MNPIQRNEQKHIKLTNVSKYSWQHVKTIQTRTLRVMSYIPSSTKKPVLPTRPTRPCTSRAPHGLCPFVVLFTFNKAIESVGNFCFVGCSLISSFFSKIFPFEWLCKFRPTMIRLCQDFGSENLFGQSALLMNAIYIVLPQDDL